VDVRAFVTTLDDLLAEANRLLEDARDLGADRDAPPIVFDATMELSSSSWSTTSSTTSSEPESVVNLDEAEMRLVRGGFLGWKETEALKAAGRLLQGNDLLRARLVAGVRLGWEDLRKLGLPPQPGVDLDSRESDLDVVKAREALLDVATSSSVSSSSDEPSVEEPVPPPTEPPQGKYGRIDTLLREQAPQELSSKSTFSTTSSSIDTRPTLERRLSRLEPNVRQKVEKALLKQGVDEARTQLGGLGERAKHVAGTERAKKHLEEARERLKRRLGVRDEVEERLYTSNLFDSTEALRARGEEMPSPSDDRFGSLHQGEHQRYNVGDEVSSVVLGAGVDDAKVTARDGGTVTRVTTTGLSEEERAKLKLRGGPDGLRRRTARCTTPPGRRRRSASAARARAARCG
jgi:hypothetical protein